MLERIGGDIGHELPAARAYVDTGPVIAIVLVSLILYMVINPRPLLQVYVRSVPEPHRGAASRAFARSSRAVVGCMYSNLGVGVALAMVAAFGLIGALVATPLAGFIKAYYDEFYLAHRAPVDESERPHRQDAPVEIMMKETFDILGSGDPNWWQAVVRAILVYAVALVLVRVGEKRALGKNTALDVVVAVMLGSS